MTTLFFFKRTFLHPAFHSPSALRPSPGPNTAGRRLRGSACRDAAADGWARDVASLSEDVTGSGGGPSTLIVPGRCPATRLRAKARAAAKARTDAQRVVKTPTAAERVRIPDSAAWSSTARDAARCHPSPSPGSKSSASPSAAGSCARNSCAKGRAGNPCFCAAACKARRLRSGQAGKPRRARSRRLGERWRAGVRP